MKAAESKSSILFRHWIRKNKYHTAALEMKDSRGKSSFPFGEVSSAQLNYALAIRSDEGVFMRVQAVAEGMPDYIYMRNEPSYIVIKFPKSLCIIDPETFILEKKRNKRSSLTESRAKDIAVKVINI